MRSWIKTDRLKFKIGSLEWLNYFGLPTGLIALSFINLYSLLSGVEGTIRDTLTISFVITMITGLSGYIIQLQRLKFKKFKLTKDIESFKEDVRSQLQKCNWKVEYDNKEYIQASYKGGFFNLDMLTLKFRKSEVLWNVIHHPFSHNSIAAFVTFNRQGRKMIDKLKTCA